MARLLIAAEEEDSVVRSGRNAKGYQQIDSESGESDKLVISKKRDNSSGRRQFDANHDEQQNHRDDGTVHE